MFAIIAIVAVVAVVAGVGYLAHKAPPLALVGLTAAGALVVLPYTVTSDPDMDVVIDPTTGQATTTVNGVGVKPTATCSSPTRSAAGPSPRRSTSASRWRSPWSASTSTTTASI